MQYLNTMSHQIGPIVGVAKHCAPVELSPYIASFIHSHHGYSCREMPDAMSINPDLLQNGAASMHQLGIHCLAFTTIHDT